MASIKKIVVSVTRDMGKRQPLWTGGGNINWYSHYAKQYGGFTQKIKSRTIQPSNSTSGYITEGTEITVSKSYLPPHVHFSIIYSRSDMKRTLRSTEEWMDNENVTIYVCIYISHYTYIYTHTHTFFNWSIFGLQCCVNFCCTVNHYP